MCILTLCLLIASPRDPRLERLKELLPPAEVRILTEVADEYSLEGDARRLLFVIRLIENGRNGKEMGVITPEAMRFKDDPVKSLRLQAQWAAGTIKKRFNGDLEAFGNRWCPPHAHPLNLNWLPAARKLMK